MKLTFNELKLFRNYLVAKRAHAKTSIPMGAKVWEDWMHGTIQKLEDEMYPQEADPI